MERLIDRRRGHAAPAPSRNGTNPICRFGPWYRAGRERAGAGLVASVCSDDQTEEPGGDASPREPRRLDAAAAARRAGQAGEGTAKALRPFSPLPPHRPAARDEPAAHAPHVPDGPPLSRAQHRGVAGYRHPEVAKNPHSPHMKGLACDFRVAGVKNTTLRDYLRRNFNKVGVGYYPNSS